ncbi:phosphoribosyl-AMP cyclohydrolase [Candidatus Tremblaya phenacola]
MIFITTGYIVGVYRICLDCDKDSVLIGSLIKGNTCHLGNYSCFCSE